MAHGIKIKSGKKPKSHIEYTQSREKEVKSLGNAIVALSEYPFEDEFENLARPLVDKLIQRLDNISMQGQSNSIRLSKGRV